jgi:hypothetical protein
VTSGKLRAMSQFAFQDIFESDHHEDTPYKKLSSHLLRPGHLQQLRKILDDPEASPTTGSSRSTC